MSGAVLTVLGMAGLVLGGRWIVDSSVRIAGALGAPEVIIGLTLVAVGGPVAVIHPVPVGRELMAREHPNLLIMTAALVLATLTRSRIGRAAGTGLLLLYAALLAWWVS